MLTNYSFQILLTLKNEITKQGIINQGMIWERKNKNFEFFLPENVIDLFGQRSVGFMAVNLGGFASNVHFAFGLFDLIFFEGIFQLCHFTSNICKSRREKMCKQMYTSKLNKFDQLIGKTNIGVSLQEEKSFVNRLWAES